jgi:hypothetical protein
MESDAAPGSAAPPTRRPEAEVPPVPMTSPPMPFTDWPIGATQVIGGATPNSVDSPLMGH